MRQTLIELIVDLLWDLFRGSIALLLILNIGCSGSGGGQASLPKPDLPIIVVPQVTLSAKSGGNFECLIYNGSILDTLLCSSYLPNGQNDSINFGPGSMNCYNNGSTCDDTNGTFSIVAQGNLTDLWTWDDTLCFQAEVSTRPYSRTQGSATYCLGEATLNAVYALFPIVYGSSYSTPANGSVDLTTYYEIFAGGDMTVEFFATQTNTLDPIPSDGSTLTSSRDIICEINAGILTCPDFTVTGL